MASTEKTARNIAKPSTSPRRMMPCGIGRLEVRDIIASMSASYHMFSAPDAPAPMAMNSNAVKPITGFICPGAATMPTSAVNTTSDMTRGFSKLEIVARRRQAWCQEIRTGMRTRFRRGERRGQGRGVVSIDIVRRSLQMPEIT